MEVGEFRVKFYVNKITIGFYLMVKDFSINLI